MTIATATAATALAASSSSATLLADALLADTVPTAATTGLTPMAALPQQLEQLAGLGILLVSLALAALSFLAWRRERDRRMLVVTVAYAMFAVNGFVVFAEYVVLDYGLLPVGQVELIEHASAFLILVGLLAFFVAITRE